MFDTRLVLKNIKRENFVDANEIIDEIVLCLTLKSTKVVGFNILSNLATCLCESALLPHFGCSSLRSHVTSSTTFSFGDTKTRASSLMLKRQMSVFETSCIFRVITLVRDIFAIWCVSTIFASLFLLFEWRNPHPIAPIFNLSEEILLQSLYVRDKTLYILKRRYRNHKVNHLQSYVGNTLPSVWMSKKLTP